MSRETTAWLNTQTLIGYTDKRGNAWHYRKQYQGAEPNHYPRAIPVADVRRRLFNWSAVAAPVSARVTLDNGTEVQMPAPDHMAMCRSDSGLVLGINSARYKAHDYDQWLIRNVESILDADLCIGSAGLLRRGAQAWVQVEMEDTLSVEGVQFRPFLTAATSLDGSLQTTYLTGSQVVVCDNTLSVAMHGSATAYRVRHSSNSLQRLTDAREALQIVHGTADAFAAEVQALTSQRVTEAEWNKFVDLYTAPGHDLNAPTTVRSRSIAATKAAALDDLWTRDERATPWRGTAYGVLAAVNTYAHHCATVRGADRHTRNTARMISGKVADLDAEILDLLSTATGREIVRA